MSSLLGRHVYESALLEAAWVLLGSHLFARLSARPATKGLKSIVWPASEQARSNLEQGYEAGLQAGPLGGSKLGRLQLAILSFQWQVYPIMLLLASLQHEYPPHATRSH